MEINYKKELTDIDAQINNLIFKRRQLENKMIEIIQNNKMNKKLLNKPKPPNIWDDWKSATDAVNWALEILPNENSDRLRDMLITLGDIDLDRDIKGQIWINMILAMKKHQGNEQKLLESQ